MIMCKIIRGMRSKYWVSGDSILGCRTESPDDVGVATWVLQAGFSILEVGKTRVCARVCVSLVWRAL